MASLVTSAPAHRDVDRAEAGFDRAARARRLRPDGEPQAAERLHIAAAGVDDQTRHATRLHRRRQQLADHAIGAVRHAGDDEHVAGCALPMATCTISCRRRLSAVTAGPATGPGDNRPQIGQETRAALRFVGRRAPEGGEPAGHVGRERRFLSDHDANHESSVVSCGNTRW
jgi:hypothetical protein